MKKNDLIKMLEGIKGNPEIAVWNGFVGDWQALDNSIQTLELVKHTPEHIEMMINYQRLKDNRPVITKDDLAERMKKEKWELKNRFYDENESLKYYGKKRKKLLILNCKARGKACADRLGKIEY